MADSIAKRGGGPTKTSAIDEFKDPLNTLLGSDEDEEIEVNTSSLEVIDVKPQTDEKTITVPDLNSTLVSLTLKLDDGSADTADTRDLQVYVDSPEKHTTAMESFVTFRMNTKTTRSEYDNHEYSVRRRYNDFLWLRQQLEHGHPTHVIPPLPEKHRMRQLDRFSMEFILVRKAALQMFLTRLADHPVLSFDKHLQIFLTGKQYEFQAHKKQGSGFMTRMADSFHTMSASYMMKNRPPEYHVLQEYVQSFGEKLSTLERVQSRVLREQTEYLSNLKEMGPIFTLWANAEDNLCPTLVAMATALDKCMLALQGELDAADVTFMQPLKEYQLYAESIKAVLKRRDAIQMEYELTVEEVNRKKDERESVKISDQNYSFGAFFGKDPEDIKKQKQDKIDKQIEELSALVDHLSDKTVCANADLKADMERWNRNKRRDFKQLFTALADRQINLYQKCLDAWEEVVVAIHHAKSESTD